jgi:two-component system, LytTR family, response regulator
MIRALLVDDEENNLENLEFMLVNDCEGLKVAGKARNAAEARKWLSQNTADVIFLDIHMPGETGFQLLQTLSTDSFKKVVFVTAHNEYALQAIKANALDYIVKPISINELQNTVTKIKTSLAHPGIAVENEQVLSQFLESLGQRSARKKIALPHLGGISFIEVDDIVSLQADSNYTILHLLNMQKMVISKTLKDFEELLDETQFARIHKSYIVSLKYIKEYSTIDGGIVKMTDGNQWSISRRQLEIFLQKMKTSSLMFGK